MNQENKYYTPDISEFHVGFEYEMLGEDLVTWTPQIFKYPFNRKGLINYKDHFRVKLLNKEDIEDLGFDGYEPPMEYNHSWKYKGSKEPKIYVWFNNPIPVVRIYGNFPQTLFQGIIKNKSELQRLIKQLGI